MFSCSVEYLHHQADDLWRMTARLDGVTLGYVEKRSVTRSDLFDFMRSHFPGCGRADGAIDATGIRLNDAASYVFGQSDAETEESAAGLFVLAQNARSVGDLEEACRLTTLALTRKDAARALAERYTSRPNNFFRIG